MEILITNDDGAGSPLFWVAVNYFKMLGNITVVAPSQEQSWTAKSMVRSRSLRAEQAQRGDLTYSLFDGTPADCVNYGVHHLFDQGKPDLVVSGINVGLNTGIGFLLSSGTVGACLEGNLSGVPGLALSQQVSSSVMGRWKRESYIEDETRERMESGVIAALDKLFEGNLLPGLLASRPPITYSVNFPFEASGEPVLEEALLGHTIYGQAFELGGDGSYIHRTLDIEFDTRDDSDTNILLEDKKVSVTPINIWEIGQKKLGLFHREESEC